MNQQVRAILHEDYVKSYFCLLNLFSFYLNIFNADFWKYFSTSKGLEREEWKVQKEGKMF